jgi:hypothetical protein
MEGWYLGMVMGKGLCGLKQEHAKGAFLIVYWVTWDRQSRAQRRTVVAEAGGDGAVGGLMGGEMKNRGERVLPAGLCAAM